MIFQVFSRSAQGSLDKFTHHLQASTDSREQVLLEKINRCDYTVLLIAGDEIDLNGGQPTGIDKKTLYILSDAWKNVLLAISNRKKPEIYRSWQPIRQISEGVQLNQQNKSLILRRLRQSDNRDFFIVLLTGKEPAGLPEHELLMLSELWQLKQGNLPIHASGVKHLDQLFVFTGPSGAGKSTIAEMSREMGDRVIDEDRILVRPRAEGGYTADGWGYGFVHCEAPLRAFFHLVKDTKDELVPISPMQVTQRMLERQGDFLGGMFVGELLRIAFRQASEMARQVSGFELHFRKSPDFWKLIDAQFAD